MKTYVILHNVRSAHNVGSIFRTADGAGVSKIFLTGYTPAPVDRFGRIQKEIQKTSLGATNSVSWESAVNITDLIARLQNDGITVVAVEQHPRAIDYRTFTPRRDTAFIFGNEVEGIPSDVSESADTIIHAPMLGVKESLNVSVCVGVVLFQYTPRSL